MGIPIFQAKPMSGHAAAPAPAPAAAGPAPAQDPVKDLALRIYIELAGRAYADGAQDKKPDPKALANLSFRLAEAFLQVHRDANAAMVEDARKRDSFSFDDVDMGSMMKG